MSGDEGKRPSLRLLPGGRSTGELHRGPESEEDHWESILRRAAAVVGLEEDELSQRFRESAAKGRDVAESYLDPIAHGEREEDGRGGPAVPAGTVFGGVFDALPSPAVAMAGAGEETEPSLSPKQAARSPQVKHKPKREKRRKRRLEHSRKRLEELRATMFEGQVCDVPPFPELKPEIRAANLAVMRDGTGRKACELAAKLPLGQQLAIYAGAYAVADKIRTGRAHHITREEVAGAQLPEHTGKLKAALEIVREEVAPSPWFRRLVCCAWALWGHRHKLSEEARKAWRGGVFTVEGFCEGALRWLVPKADGTQWSRAALFRRDGPFGLLGAATKQLGRKVANHPGMSLYTRWQPPHVVATYKGPWRMNSSGERERYALAQHRYDSEMSGRTALSLARRARGKLRDFARLIVAALMPWVNLPNRRRRGAAELEEAVAPAAVSEPPEERLARAPP